MSIVLDAARGILAALQPLTGSRATGTVTARATSSPVFVPRNAYLLPVVNGQIRTELVFKTAAGPALAPNKGAWQVTDAGANIGVLSMIGGARHNLPAGTVLRWDPPIAGLEPTVTVGAAGLTGAEDPAMFGGLKAAVIADEFGAPAAGLEAFRSQLGGLPGLILIWQASDPADGSTVSTLARGDGRMGQNSVLMAERFLAVILSNRADGAHFRRSEALEAMDEATLWLTDRTSVDGGCISSPGGVQIVGRTRLQGNRQLYLEHDVRAISLAVTRAYTRHDVRMFNDWLKTRTRATVADAAHPTPKDVTDITVDM